MSLAAILAVAIGAALGGAARHKITMSAREAARYPGTTLGTTIANVLACLLLGIFAHLLAKNTWGQPIYLFAGVGFCGALSTWSTLALGTAELIDAAEGRAAMSYVLANVVLGYLALVAGWALVPA